MGRILRDGAAGYVQLADLGVYPVCDVQAGAVGGHGDLSWPVEARSRARAIGGAAAAAPAAVVLEPAGLAGDAAPNLFAPPNRAEVALPPP